MVRKSQQKLSTRFQQKSPDPTPEEIAERAAEIRKEWSEHVWQRQRRRFGASVPKGTYRLSCEVAEE